MSFFLASEPWVASGYGVIAALQFMLVAALWASRGLWRGKDVAPESPGSSGGALSNREALRLPNVKLALVSFVCFSITEWTTGLWSGTYLVGVEGMAPAVAPAGRAAFIGGITLGRLLSSFLTMRFTNEALIAGTAGLRGEHLDHLCRSRWDFPP